MVVTHPVSEREREKYNKIWQVQEYANFSPGEAAVDWFLKEWSWPHRGEISKKRVLDVGCGSGKAGAKFAEMGARVTLIDWPETFLRVETPPGLPTLGTCLWHNWPAKLGIKADLAFCVDVLEHLPQEFTMLSAHNILRSAHYAFIQVAHFDDIVHGERLIGEPVHLTVKPYVWWRDRLADLGGKLVEARDCLERSSFLLEGI